MEAAKANRPLDRLTLAEVGSADLARLPDASPRELGRVAVWVRRDHPHLEVRSGRIAAGVLGLVSASTAVDAVALLGRAIKVRDYQLLLTILPAHEQAHWTAERLADHIESESHALAWQALAEAIGAGQRLAARAVAEDRAMVSVEGTTLVLGREADGWKVLDIRPIDLYAPQR